KFYDDDIERLRWILRQQRENFLPLKVIKGRLEQQRHGGVLDDDGADSQPARVEPAAPRQQPAEPVERPNPLDVGPSAASLTADELTAASGLDARELAELERFGLLAGRPAAGGVYYDEEALLVARLAAGFMRHGVEARHLRMYR